MLHNAVVFFVIAVTAEAAVAVIASHMAHPRQSSGGRSKPGRSTRNTMAPADHELVDLSEPNSPTAKSPA